MYDLRESLLGIGLVYSQTGFNLFNFEMLTEMLNGFECILSIKVGYIQSKFIFHLSISTMATYHKVISHRADDQIAWIEGASYKRESMVSFYSSIYQALKDFGAGEEECEVVTITKTSPETEAQVFHNHIELKEFSVVTIQPLRKITALLSPEQLLSWVRLFPRALRYIFPAAQMAPVAKNDDARAAVRNLSLEKLDAEIEVLQVQLEILQKKRQSFLE